MIVAPATKRIRMFAARLAAVVLAVTLTAVVASVPEGVQAAEPIESSRTSGAGHDAVSIRLDSLTPVVTAHSGYTATLTLNNASRQDIHGGTLTVGTNALYTFSSQVDMQQWADGTSRIPAFGTIDSVHVGEIVSGAHTNVRVSVKPNNAQLKAMTSWGPKPLLFSFISQDSQNDAGKTIRSQATSFLTRSPEGLRTAGTPPLDITATMPLTAGSWAASSTAVDTLLAPGKSQRTAASKDTRALTDAATPSANVRQSIIQLLSEHTEIQTVADPSYLATLDERPHIAAMMQPAHFDIAAATRINSQLLRNAGITTEQWNRAAAQAQLPRDTGGADTDAIAWQGSESWTLSSLTSARKQGYHTVIASNDFESDSPMAAHTGKYSITTSAGKVTVLAAQQALSRLAQGEASSGQAHAEGTSAGRIAKFMALSAFYQMEQPYAERVLLVCLDGVDGLDTTGKLMTELEKAPWIKLNGLRSLLSATPYLSGNAAKQAIPEDRSGNAAPAVLNAVESLAASRRDIVRFSSSILSDPSTTTSTPTSSQDSPMASRGTATENSANSGRDPDPWLRTLLAAHDSWAFHALADTASRTAMTDAANKLSQSLLSGVSIEPSEPLTVVGESATLPVTISNGYRYPVNVMANSITDSTEIVTTRTAWAILPPRAETQVTFAIRVLATGRATAHLTLLDRNGMTFSQAKATQITSVLRLDDGAGLVLLAVAAVFGVLGIWRQFHRRKDDDE